MKKQSTQAGFNTKFKESINPVSLDKMSIKQLKKLLKMLKDVK